MLQELQNSNPVYSRYFSCFYAIEKGKTLNMQNLHLYQDYFEKRGFKILFKSLAVCSLQSFGTLSTVNFSIMANKALVGQTTGTLCAFETVIMPGFIFVVNHTGSSSKSCNRILAASTLLGNTFLVALNTVKLILYSCKTLPTQLLLAVGANETLGMPRLFLVSETSRSDGILAFSTGLGKFVLVAGDTVEFITLWEEAPRSNHLLALAASKAVLMPDHLLVFNILVSCDDRLEAALTPGCLVSGSAVATPDLVVLPQHEGLVDQGRVALEAAEAAVMPVTVLEMQLLGVSANGFLALDAGVGTDLLKALDAAVAALLLHVLLALQRVAAVVAVKALRHGAHAVTAGP